MKKQPSFSLVKMLAMPHLVWKYYRRPRVYLCLLPTINSLAASRKNYPYLTKFIFRYVIMQIQIQTHRKTIHTYHSYQGGL